MSIWERNDASGTIKENPLNLTAEEEKTIAEIQSALKSHASHQPVIGDLRDATVARFAKRESFDVKATVDHIVEYLQWRKDNNVDTVLDNLDNAKIDLVRKIVPWSYHGFDNDGRTIYFERTGMVNVAALSDFNICPEATFYYSHIVGMEKIHKSLHESSLKRGKRVDGLCTILDMTGLGFGHRSAIPILKTATDFDNKYYPEMLERLYIVNAPWVAPYLYQAVQLFLPKAVVERLQVIHDPAQFLPTVIPLEHLAAEYGGQCKSCDGKCCAVLDSSDLHAVAKSDDGLEKVNVAYDFSRELACDGAGYQFNWYFECENGYDIDFSVEIDDGQSKVMAKQPSRCTTNKGSFVSTKACKLTFKWDNNFSYFTSKDVKFLISVMKEDKVTKQ